MLASKIGYFSLPGETVFIQIAICQSQSGSTWCQVMDLWKFHLIIQKSIRLYNIQSKMMNHDDDEYRPIRSCFVFISAIILFSIYYGSKHAETQPVIIFNTLGMEVHRIDSYKTNFLFKLWVFLIRLQFCFYKHYTTVTYIHLEIAKQKVFNF